MASSADREVQPERCITPKDQAQVSRQKQPYFDSTHRLQVQFSKHPCEGSVREAHVSRLHRTASDMSVQSRLLQQILTLTLFAASSHKVSLECHIAALLCL